MQRLTLVLVMAPALILASTTLCTPVWRDWRVKYPRDMVRFRPTSQVTVAMAWDVLGSYRQAFLRRRVLRTSDGARDPDEADDVGGWCDSRCCWC